MKSAFLNSSSVLRLVGLPALVIAAIPATAQVGTARLGAHNGALGGGAALQGMTRPLGGFSNGFVPGYSNGRAGVGSRGYGTYGSRRGIAGYPYAYSIWVPDYFDYLDQSSPYYGAPYGYPPPVPPPDAGALNGAAPGQPVIINQYFSGPPPGAAQQPPYPPQPNNSSTAVPGGPLGDPQNYYLIAYKDHAVYPALAYWVEDKTLHYVTTENTHNQASFDLIDLPLTRQLNQDRNVTFSVAGQ